MPGTWPADLPAWPARAVERAGHRIGEHDTDVVIGVRPPGGWLVGSRELDSPVTLVAVPPVVVW